MSMPPEICPNCGAEVPPRARACPECGADEQTGWSDKVHEQQLGLPDEEFDYDEFVKEEFGAHQAKTLRPRGISWVWWLTAVVLLLLFLAWLLHV